MTTTWTLEMVAARRATGDSLVTLGDWCASYEITPPAKCAVLHLYRNHGQNTVETDPRNGSVFPSVEAAELYALNAGRLMWFRDWKAEQAAIAQPVVV